MPHQVTTRAGASRSRAFAAACGVLAVALAGLTSACSDLGGAADPRAGDLLIVDMDAGPAQPDGERLGVIFRARPEGDEGDAANRFELSTFAEDGRWREPVDVLVLPDKCVLILDQQWQPDDGPARGAIFRTYWAGGPVTLLWSDPRARKLVAMAFSRRDRTLYVSDRDADPLALGQNTGCVFAIPIASDDTAGEATIAAAGPELVTPGALVVLNDNRVLVMDADSNPHQMHLADGRAATPGVLFELRDGALVELLVPDVTVSPVALIERDLRDPRELQRERDRERSRNRSRNRERHVISIGTGPREPQAIEESDDEGDVDAADDNAPWEPDAAIDELPDPKLTLFLLDANEGTESGVVGDGALFRVDFTAHGPTLSKLLDSLTVGRPRAMVDPAGGDVLADGRLVIADANADPLALGDDGTKKGVYGTGRGALLVVDPDKGSVDTLLASERFVSPVIVRRVR